MMTNLVATIVFSIVTNWMTVSTTYPAPCSFQGCAVYHPTLLNQKGLILSNTTAIIQWKDQKMDVVVESVKIGETNRNTYDSSLFYPLRYHEDRH